MVRNSILFVLNEVFKQINIDEDEIINVVSSIKHIHIFDDVLDFRQENKIVYPLSDILLMAFLVILERENKYILEILRLPKNYQGYNEFRNMKCFVKLTSYKKNKQVIIRYFVTDLVKLNEIEYAVNERWKIENGLHNPKDTFLHEDEFRCTDSKAIKNIVVMNNLIIQLMHIYQAVSGYNLRITKIALSTNTYNEILKLLVIMTSEEIRDKLIEAVKKINKD